jgi:glycerol kinase
MGAAYLAGLAVGFWSDRETLTRNWEADVLFSPQRPATAMTAARAAWNRAIAHSREWGQSAIC